MKSNNYKIGLIALGVSLVATGCAKPYEKANSLYNSPQGRIAVVQRLSKQEILDIEKEIVFSPEDITDFDNYCGIKFPVDVQTQRRNSAKREVLENLAGVINVTCFGEPKIECSVKSSRDMNDSLGKIYVDPSSQRIIDSMLTDSTLIGYAVDSAIKNNYLSIEERECKNKIIYERAKKQTKGTLEGIGKGLKDFWNNTAKQKLEDSVKWIDSQYKSTKECLDAGNSAEYCTKIAVGMQDKN